MFISSADLVKFLVFGESLSGLLIGYGYGLGGYVCTFEKRYVLDLLSSQHVRQQMVLNDRISNLRRPKCRGLCPYAKEGSQLVLMGLLEKQIIPIASLYYAAWT